MKYTDVSLRKKVRVKKLVAKRKTQYLKAHKSEWAFQNLKVIYIVATLALVLQLVAPAVLGAPKALAVNPAGDLDQCANGSSASPVPCTGSAWQNGNLNQNQAHYVEGQSVPYRVILTNVPTTGTNTLVFEYDILRGGKHSLDFITTYNRTENTANACFGVSPCVAGTSGVIPAPSTSGSSVAGMPTTSFNAIPSAQRNISIFNGNVTGVSYISQGSLAVSDSSTNVAVTFTASQPTVVIAWGAHIASRLDWGVGNSAGSINGSSYHTRIGGQDRSLSAAAVVFGNLTVVKHVINTGGGSAVASDFLISITGNSPNPASFPGNENGTSVVLQTGSYSVTETTVSGYDPTYSTDCTGTIAASDNKTCTITNTFQPPPPTTATLTLVKNIVNDNGGQALSTAWTLSASGPTNISGATGSTTVTNDTVNPGTYTLSESGGPSGYTAGNWSCTGGGTLSGDQLTLATGENVTCTITNNDNAPALHLRKTVINDNGGTAVATSWTLTATGTGGTPTNLSGAAPVDSGANFKADTYTLGESGGPSGYSASTWSCSGGIQNGNQITVGLGQSATCTITNDDNAPHLTLNKVVINDNGGTSVESAWTLTANGGTAGILFGPGATGSTDVVSGSTFKAGTYTLSETGPAGYVSSAWSCQGGSQNGSAITLGVGESATCTITNDDRPSNIIIIKNTQGLEGATEDGSFGFTVSGPNQYQNNPIIVTSGGTGTTQISGVNAGPYSISEASQDGWQLSSETCTAGSPSSFTLGSGETVTCTFANSKLPPPVGTITIVKNTIGSDGTFGFTTTGGSTVAADFGISTSGNTGSVTFNDVAIGIYTISENSVDGWNFTNLSCQGGTALPVIDGATASVTIATGDNVTCTYTNTAKGHLIVKKALTNDNGGTMNSQDFSFSVNGGQAQIFNANGENDLLVDPGIYSVVELEANTGGYSTTDNNCSEVQISAGGTATCTITNNDVEPSLTLIKEVSGGDASPSDWTLSAGSEAGELTGPGPSVSSDPEFQAGTYTLSEAPTNNESSVTNDYANSNWACTGNGTWNEEDSQHVILDEGQSETCTITNTYAPTQVDLAVTKTVGDGQSSVSANTGDSATFAVTVTNGGPADATGVIVSDIVPSGLTITSTSTSVGLFDGSTWIVGNLAKGASATLSITATVNSGTEGETLTNTASVSANQQDFNSDNDSDSASVVVNTPQPPPPPSGGGGPPSGGGSAIVGSISGVVYNDANGNGVQDPGEVVLSGWTVYLDTNDNGVQDPGETAVTTSASGGYTFSPLNPATYIVREVLPSTWTLTTPSDSKYVVPVSSNSFIGKNFGNRQGQVLGASTDASTTPPPQVLGTATQLPRTGMPLVELLLLPLAFLFPWLKRKVRA